MMGPVWHRARRNEADNGEALQSDVMRFTAILALCLMAIFALVQSIPLHPGQKRTEPQNAATTLPGGPTTLAPEASESLPSGTTSSAEVTAAEPVLAAGRPLAPKPAEPRAIIPLPRRPPEVPHVSPESTDQRGSASIHEPRMVGAKSPTATPAAAQTERRVGVVESLAAPPQPEPVTLMEVAKVAEQQGLSLRFSSDDALLALVAQRRVQVYAWVADATWQLVSERGELRFASSAKPGRFHQMTLDTVPGVLVRAFGRAVPARLADAARWGVVLPLAIGRQVKALVNRHAKGTLVIQADGRVRLQGAG